MGRRLSPARFVALVSTLLMLYSLASVANRFFEALSQVNTARSENEELLELCTSGQARGSAIMRRSCLEARAERASPIVFKALTKAVNDAFKEFADAIGSPLKLICVLLFLLSSVVMPVVPWARMLAGMQAPEPEALNDVHYISYAPPMERGGKLRRRVRGAMRALRLRRGNSSPRIEELDGDYAQDDLEPGARGHTCASLLGVGGPGEVAVPMAGWEEVPIGNGIAAPPSLLHDKTD